MTPSTVSLRDVVERLGDAVIEIVPAADPDGDVDRVDVPAVDVPVVAVTHDSRSVSPQSMFACLPGATADGHDFAADAVAAGATSLLVERVLDGVGAATQVVVHESRPQLGLVAAEVTGNPSEALLGVGITGTNGKTTVASMLAAILEAVGHPTGVIGTLSGPRTTPEAPELQATLAGFVAAGKTAAVLEVSSHALVLHRVDGTRFDLVVFTNLGHDHLDLHGTQEDYFRAKAMLFDPRFAPRGVINVDDVHGRLLADAVRADGFDVVEYSVDELTDVHVEASRLRYRWRGHDVEVNMGGHFNVSNSLAALVTATELGLPVEAALTGLRELAPVPGRFEVVSAGDGSPGPTVVVDYAHTPDGLAEAISSARRVAGDADVVAVFGCGGDRDQPKRPLMGEVAARLADRVIVTSDNPRTEDPQQIVDDVLAGVDAHYRRRVTSHVDRRTAIHIAVAEAAPGDIVLVAGKGHEATQDIGGQRHDFDDRAVAAEALTARGTGQSTPGAVS